MKHAVVVFVHGLFASGRSWTRFRDLIACDPDLANLNLLDFEYSTPKFNLNPLRQIPNYDVLADSLQTFLETVAAEYSAVVLVSHSQGGLIVQRYLARMVMGARGNDLKRIRRIVMFACPNSGSEIFLLLRRRAWFWSHAQERELRPINESVGATQQVIINRIVHAQQVAPDQCPVVFQTFAGEQDNVVTPTSAKGVFPDTGVLPGDHFSIIQPDSHRHRAYLALKMNLMAAFGVGELQIEGVQSPASPPAYPNPDFTGKTTSFSFSATPDMQASLNNSTVVAKLDLTARTVEFIVTPETALAWIRKLSEEDSTND